MVVAPIALLDWKAVFRQRAKAARAAAAKRQPNAKQFAASHFMTRIAPEKPATIALYHPKGDELDTWPLAEALMKDGHAILLPVVVGKDEPLQFRLWEMDKGLVDGRYGIATPPEDAPVHRPDIVVVPLLGVRPDGARLGMGGGYYDRTLAALREDGDVLAIGYGYSDQRMDRFPVDAHDQFLDGFVDEQAADLIERRR